MLRGLKKSSMPTSAVVEAMGYQSDAALRHALATWAWLRRATAETQRYRTRFFPVRRSSF
jgi:hypothetical protein